jgi:N-acyl-D-aspartate/D-glutamate deacylase
MPMAIKLRLNFASGFVLDMLPGWDKLMALPASEKLALLGSPEGRERMRGPAEASESRFARWGTYQLAECFSDETRRYEGRSIADIATEEHRDPFDVMADIVVADELRTSFGFSPGRDTAADKEALAETLRDPRIVVGASDAGAHLDMIDTFRYTTVMLASCVRADRLIGLEEAVHLLTQVPAELHGLRDRGVLEQGAWADLVVFDEDTVASDEVHTRADLPGGESRLFAEAVGVHRVVVNGRTIVDHGEITDARPGRVLRSGRDTATPSMAP